jgi:hypothetical protein
MRKFLTFLIALAAIIFAVVSPSSAQGFNGGGFNVGLGPFASSSGYTGPGDVFSTSPLAAYSCSEAYNAAGANTSTSACDLVDSAAPTVVICTLRFTSTGNVDLTAYCPGSVTPAAKCAAATGGVCNISKAYDLTGGGNPAIQVTAVNQPTLTFSSTPLGTLPAINCGTGSSISLQTSGTFTQAQPLAMSAVLIRTTGTALGGAIGSAAVNQAFIGSGAGASLAAVDGGSPLTAAATDNSWYSLGGLINGNSLTSAINVNGADTAGNAGVNGISAAGIRLCRAETAQFEGLIAEAMIWATTTTSTNRNAISANQHSAGRYNF